MPKNGNNGGNGGAAAAAPQEPKEDTGKVKVHVTTSNYYEAVKDGKTLKVPVGTLLRLPRVVARADVASARCGPPPDFREGKNVEFWKELGFV